MQSESELWTIESISNESNQSSQSSVTKAVLDKLGAPSYLVNPGVCRLHKDQTIGDNCCSWEHGKTYAFKTPFYYWRKNGSVEPLHCEKDKAGNEFLLLDEGYIMYSGSEEIGHLPKCWHRPNIYTA